MGKQLSKEEIISNILEGLRFKTKKLCAYALFVLLAGLICSLFIDGAKIVIAVFILLEAFLIFGLIDVGFNKKRVKQGKYRAENVICVRKRKEEVQNTDSYEDCIYYISYLCADEQKKHDIKVNEFTYSQLIEGQEYVLVYLGWYSKKPWFFLSPE